MVTNYEPNDNNNTTIHNNRYNDQQDTKIMGEVEHVLNQTIEIEHRIQSNEMVGEEKKDDDEIYGINLSLNTTNTDTTTTAPNSSSNNSCCSSHSKSMYFANDDVLLVEKLQQNVNDDENCFSIISYYDDDDHFYQETESNMLHSNATSNKSTTTVNANATRQHQVDHVNHKSSTGIDTAVVHDDIDKMKPPKLAPLKRRNYYNHNKKDNLSFGSIVTNNNTAAISTETAEVVPAFNNYRTTRSTQNNCNSTRDMSDSSHKTTVSTKTRNKKKQQQQQQMTQSNHISYTKSLLLRVCYTKHSTSISSYTLRFSKLKSSSALFCCMVLIGYGLCLLYLFQKLDQQHQQEFQTKFLFWHHLPNSQQQQQQQQPDELDHRNSSKNHSNSNAIATKINMEKSKAITNLRHIQQQQQKQQDEHNDLMTTNTNHKTNHHHHHRVMKNKNHNKKSMMNNSFNSKNNSSSRLKSTTTSFATSAGTVILDNKSRTSFSDKNDLYDDNDSDHKGNTDNNNSNTNTWHWIVSIKNKHYHNKLLRPLTPQKQQYDSVVAAVIAAEQTNQRQQRQKQRRRQRPLNKHDRLRALRIRKEEENRKRPDYNGLLIHHHSYNISEMGSRIIQIQHDEYRLHKERKQLLRQMDEPVYHDGETIEFEPYYPYDDIDFSKKFDTTTTSTGIKNDVTESLLTKKERDGRLYERCYRPKWTYNIYPSCNQMHELFVYHTSAATTATNHQHHHHPYDEQLQNVQYLDHGYYRDTYLYNFLEYDHDHNNTTTSTTADASNSTTSTISVVLKSLRYHHLVDAYNVMKINSEALIMERLSSSPLISNIYHSCGTSIVVETGREWYEEVVPHRDDENEYEYDSTNNNNNDDEEKEKDTEGGYGRISQQVLDSVYEHNGTTVHSFNNLTNIEKLDYALVMAESLAVLHGYKDGVITMDDIEIHQWLKRITTATTTASSRGSTTSTTTLPMTPGATELILNDFGNSAFVPYDPITKQYCQYYTSYVGTFRAPEEYFDGAYVDESVDIWPMGNIIFTLLTGLWPYYTIRNERHIEQQTQLEPPYINPKYNTHSYIEHQLVTIMNQCYKLNPKERISIFDVVEKLKETKTIYYATHHDQQQKQQQQRKS